MFKYPPYYRLIYVYLRHRKEDILDLAADTMPEFAHLPLLLKPDGNGKLSKRDGCLLYTSRCV